MQTSFAILVFVLSCVVQTFSLKMRCPDTIHENEAVTIEFGEGMPPYAAWVSDNSDAILHAISTNDTSGGAMDWRVDVPKGTRVMFTVVDGIMEALQSDWLVVQEDLAVMSSSMSVATVALQSSMSVLSNNAQRPTSTPTSDSSPQTQVIVPVGPLVGGIIGGLAALLIVAVVTFRLIRRPKAPSVPVVLPTVNPEYRSPIEKDAATLASPHLQSPSYRPASSAPPLTAMYGGYSEIRDAKQ